MSRGLNLLPYVPANSEEIADFAADNRTGTWKLNQFARRTAE